MSDHKALQSVLKANKGNKIFSGRLSRWVDRLLPFDFSVIHAPGRMIGLADYLSRHPSDYCGSTVKAEEMFNSWFTMNVVDEIVPPLSRELANENGPIRIKIEDKRNSSVKESVLTAHTPMRSSVISKQTLKVPISGKMSEERDLSYPKSVKIMYKQTMRTTETFEKSSV